MSEWKNLFIKQREFSSLINEKEISITQTEKIFSNKINNEVFIKCSCCNSIISRDELEDNLSVCYKCGHHFRVDSKKRVEAIFDKDSAHYFDSNMVSEDPIKFPGYSGKLKELSKNLNLSSAVLTGRGTICNIAVCFGIIDHRFMMGSMGSIEGEKLTRIIEKASAEDLPVIIFSSSGGARIHEGMVALHQMSKVAASIKRHSKKGLLYISVVTDPTTGGVNASFASIGDIIIAEPRATVGFAGKRVIKQTINETLPERFQTSEFMLEHGFIDIILPREKLRNNLYHILKLHNKDFMVKAPKHMQCIENEEMKLNVNSMKNDFTPWQKVQIARDKSRPNYHDYIEVIIDGFVEFHGDRLFKDDKAIMGGIGYLMDMPVTIICTARGKNLKENVYRNFGMAHPDGYRKALRLMKQAEKFNRPIICLVDTPGAFCGVGAEERGQGEAIAKSLMDMSDLSVPIIIVITGEGGSGGALALGVGDYTFMLENAIYSVISPEGAAAIVLKDSLKAEQISESLKFTAKDLLSMGIIDEIVEEPYGGIQNNSRVTIENLKTKIYCKCVELLTKNKDELMEERYLSIRMKGNSVLK